MKNASSARLGQSRYWEKVTPRWNLVDSGNSSTLLNSVNPSLLVFPILSYSNRNISIKGSLTMDQNYSFTGCDFCMNKSARIVSMAKSLSFLTNTILHEAQCDHKGFAWYGVEVQRGRLFGTGATFTGAYNAIYTPPNPVGLPSYWLTSCNFVSNYLGLKVMAPTTFSIFTDNTFGSGAGMLNWPPLESSPCTWVSLISKPTNPEPFAGIYAETPANQAVVSVNLPVAANPNNFLNLSNGIYLVDANSYIQGCRFENMLTGGYTNDDGFGVALFTNNTRSLEQVGLGKTSATLTFDNCLHAVYVSMEPQYAGGDVYLNSYDNRMNVGQGYTLLCANSQISQGSFINNNDIVFNGFFGIYMENAAPTSGLSITRNRITSTNAGTSVHLENFLPMGLGADYRVSVLGNLSTGAGTDGFFDGVNGVTMINFSNVLVERNTIEDFTQAGVFVQTSPDNDIRCNEITSANGLVSIFNETSANMLIDYNETEATNQGITVSDASNNSTIDCNQIGSHNTGLFYDATAITGAELPGGLSAGNTWTGTYGTLAALNSNPSFTSSLYFYRTGEINVAQTSPSFWFTLVTNGVTCGEDCPSIGELARNATELDQQIADGTVDMEGLSGYLLKTALYRDLLYYPELLSDNAVLQNFYETFTSTNAGQLIAVDKATADAFILNPDQQAEWNVAQNDLTTAFAAWAMLDSLVQAGEADAEDDQAVERTALMQQILWAEGVLDPLYAESLAERVSASSGLLSVLAGIDPATQYEANQKELETLILSTVFVDQLPSDDQKEQILQIAEQCVDEGGPAVLRARVWYYLLTGTRVSSECGGIEDRKAVDWDKENRMTPSLILSPNPAQDKIFVQLTCAATRPIGRLEILDATGKTYWVAEATSGNFSAEVNTAAWANGAYFCRFVENDKVSATARVTIQH